MDVRGAVDDRRLYEIVRGWAWARWLVAAVVVLRLVAVAGLRLYLYVDSGEYDRVDFSGDWRRPWATPYFYGLIPGDDHRIVVAQAFVGALCWSVLALAAAAWFRRPGFQAAVAVAVGCLGCTSIVTSWDAAKLSESLGISLTVLVVAAWLNFARRPDRFTALWVAVATWPWLFVRQSLLSAAWLVVLLAAIGVVVSWRNKRPLAVLGALVVVLGLQAVLASVSYSHNQEVVRENLTVIVANRVATDPAMLAWFKVHGMPTPSTGDLSVDALKADPAFVRWVGGRGRSTYVRYLALHPWYTATAPLDDFVVARHPAADPAEPPAAMLAPADTYATSRPVLPRLVEQALFDTGDTGSVVFALVVVSGWTVARRRRRSRRWLVPLLLIGVSFASLYTGWHGATPELGRLALLGALGIHLGLLLQVAFLAEDEAELWTLRR